MNTLTILTVALAAVFAALGAAGLLLGAVSTSIPVADAIGLGGLR